MPNITSANAKLVLTIRNSAGIVIGPFTVQGFSENAAYATESVEVADVRMGVDGKSAGGLVPVLTPMTISLMANSPSLPLFQAWMNAQKAFGDILTADGTVNAPSLQLAWACVKGYLRRITPIPEAQKTFSVPVVFEITWEDIIPAPIPG